MRAVRNFGHGRARATQWRADAERLTIMATRPATPTILGASREALAKNPQLRLSDPEMKPAMAEMRRRIKSDPAFRRHLLKQAGIVDAKGKLAKSFGG